MCHKQRIKDLRIFCRDFSHFRFTHFLRKVIGKNYGLRKVIRFLCTAFCGDGKGTEHSHGNRNITEGCLSLAMVSPGLWRLANCSSIIARGRERRWQLPKWCYTTLMPNRPPVQEVLLKMQLVYWKLPHIMIWWKDGKILGRPVLDRAAGL